MAPVPFVHTPITFTLCYQPMLLFPPWFCRLLLFPVKSLQLKCRTQQRVDTQRMFVEWLLDQETSLGPCRDGRVGEIAQAGNTLCRLRDFCFNGAVRLSLDISGHDQSGRVRVSLESKQLRKRKAKLASEMTVYVTPKSMRSCKGLWWSGDGWGLLSLLQGTCWAVSTLYLNVLSKIDAVCQWRTITEGPE